MAGIKNGLLPIALAVSGLFSGSALAAQLGKMEILSSADEPFEATVQIEGILVNEASSLQAGLADAESFAAARLTRDPQLQRLQFNIEQTSDPSRAVLKVTTDRPLDSGFIDALIELKWAGGQVAREYTLVVPVRSVKKTETQSTPLPAPEAPASSAAEAPTQQAVKIPEIRPKPQLPQIKAPASAAAASERQSTKSPKATEPVPQSAGAGENLRVIRGQTLSEIALELVGDGVTLNQAMAAIYEQNRSAFFGDSVHNLREGAVLALPNRTALRAKTGTEALLVLAENDDRNVYSDYARRIGLLSTVAQQESTAQTGKVAGEIQERPPVQATQSQIVDRLQVGPGGGDAVSQSDITRDELLAKDKALDEANERISMLEKNINDLQALIRMQDEQLTTTQPASESIQSEAETPAASSEQASGEVPLPAVETQLPELTQAPTEESEPVAANQPEKEEVAAVPAGSESSSLVSMLTSPWFLGLTGVLGLTVLLLLLWRLRKKADQTKDDEFDYEDDEEEGDGFDEALAWASSPDDKSETKKASGAVSVVEEEEFDLDEVLAEDKPTAAPSSELDVEAKSEVKPAAQAESEVAPEPEPEPEPESEFNPEPEPEPDLSLQPESEDASEQSTSLETDVDLDFPAEESEKTTEGAGILDDLEDMEQSVADAQNELDEIREQGNQAVLDEEDEPEEETEAIDEEADSEPVDASGAEKAFEEAAQDIDLDLGANEVDDATWQEVATKLDLAGAYVEIGDADGARELLNEIVSRGDAEQVKKAKELLADLD